MAYRLERQDLEALLLGGCFFGSGGGGTVTSARHLVQHFEAGDYYPSASVRVVDVAEAAAAADGDAVMVAYLGAPVAINGATYPDGPVLAVQRIMDRLAAQGRKLGYIAPPESGALGFVVACLVAARLGLAVIDGDGAGRAVPSLPMLTYAAAEVNPRPTMLVSQGGLQVELDVTPAAGANGAAAHQQDVAAIVERMVRPIVTDPEFHQFGGIAMWIMTPDVLPGAMPIRGTLTRALDLGRALQAGLLRDTQALAGWLRERCDLQARVLFGPGAIVAAGVDTSGGFDLGKVVLAADGDDAVRATVLYQNESLLAWSGAQAQPLAMAPDSLAYFAEGDGQQVFSNGDLLAADGTLDPALRGRRFSLIGIPAAAPLRVAGGLILESFMDQVAQLGYLGPYRPLGAAAADTSENAQ